MADVVYDPLSGVPFTKAVRLKDMVDGSFAPVVSTVANSTSNASTQRVTSGAMAPGQTAKQVAGTVSINAGATVPINTVTAGKTFYITDIHLATDSAAS